MGVTVLDLLAAKREGRRFVMVTAYDAMIARLLAEAGVPVLLVGDSLGNNHLGLPTTLPVTLEEMLHHCRAVARGAPDQLLVGDMPFGSYQGARDDALVHAMALVKAGMHMVKLEGGAGFVVELTRDLTERGVPVMGHLGLTPQSVHAMGGFRVQGRTDAQRARILADATALEEAGAAALVLEGIPRDLAAQVTAAVTIPTIGIGAGPDCDGQVLVVYDLLGMQRSPMPKFARAYGALGDGVVAAARAFADDVAAGAFPDDAHSYH